LIKGAIKTTNTLSLRPIIQDSEFRGRVVDVCEEYYKFTLIMREHADFLTDRYSERKEKEEKGRLLSQAEKEAAKPASS
jgi:arsenic resistance protein ArsH